MYEDLKEIHQRLGIFCSSDPSAEEIKQALSYFMNLEALKAKLRAHQDLSNTMEEHSHELEVLIADIRQLQLKNA